MCRIAGIFDPSSSNLLHDILTMRDSMKHGGPDGEGVYVDEQFPLALGHRRLSLLDLSDAGQQPMEDLNGDLQIVFNGEIYNFLELKRELANLGHTFKSSCDTEVILKAYMQWGRGCFSRFNGMFALAILDRRTSQLILARDHAGIKPLYYTIQGGKLFFASEIRAFTALENNWPENEKWKIYFLTFGYLPEPVTTLKHVVPLKKGTILIVDLPSLNTVHEVFSSFTFQSVITSLPEAITAVKEDLSSAVERHLISDAPIGLFLSGGLDSSLLTLLSHKTLKDNLHTISLVFEDKKFSEEEYQKIIIDKTGAKHTACLVTEEEFSHSLPEILEAMDQPSIDGINAFFICRYAHNFGLKAVLNGIGADELFGGYNAFYRTGRAGLLKKLPSFVIGLTENFGEYRKKKLSFLQRKDFLGDYLFNRGLYTPRETASILSCSINDVNAALNELDISPVKSIKSRRDAISWGEQNFYMQGQLLKDVDFMSMWHGLEVRVPFLDKALVQTVHCIDPKVKYSMFEKKHLLIKSFKEILPEYIYKRKKQGFIFPFQQWIVPVQTTQQRAPAFAKKHNKLKAGKMQWMHYWAYLLACHRSTIRYYEKDIKKILFLNLGAFRFTGGIEKFNRAFLKALSDLETEGKLLANCLSAYDTAADPRYMKADYYKGFNGNRLKFVIAAWKEAVNFDTIILSHINLSFAAWGIKKRYPRKAIVLVAHGVEVWDDHFWNKQKQLKNFIIHSADKVFSVSEFTKDAIVRMRRVPAEKVSVFHNTIDPFFSYPQKFEKPEYLMKRYALNSHHQVVFTLTRLSDTEKYKGYDKVIEVFPELKKAMPKVKYILSGKADNKESKRIVVLKQNNGLADDVHLTGFIKDEEVVDHFLLADVFIMPSRKEGFGIVFIEAMACGVPVIAGNKDGSVDALQQGQLGRLVDPDSETEILTALQDTFKQNGGLSGEQAKQLLQQKVKQTFGFETYKRNLEKILV